MARSLRLSQISFDKVTSDEQKERKNDWAGPKAISFVEAGIVCALTY